MILSEAKELKPGDMVIWRKQDLVLEVVESELCKDDYGGSDYYTIACKSADGKIEKYNHKELIVKKQ